MDNNEDDRYYTDKMMKDLLFIQEKMAGQSFEDFSNNDLLKDSMMFRLVQVSENARKLTDSFREKQAEKTSGNGRAAKTIENKKAIVAFLAANGKCKAAEIGDHIGLSSARARVLLSELTDEGKVKTEGEGRSRRYVLTDN